MQNANLRHPLSTNELFAVMYRIEEAGSSENHQFSFHGVGLRILLLIKGRHQLSFSRYRLTVSLSASSKPFTCKSTFLHFLDFDPATRTMSDLTQTSGERRDSFLQ